MDLKSLKLELLERISLLEDETRLLALKRLLDAPRGYGVPNEHLSVVKEEEALYVKLEDRSYSAEEVRNILRELMAALEADVNDLDADERVALEANRQRYLCGEGTWFTLEELEARMKARRG